MHAAIVAPLFLAQALCAPYIIHFITMAHRRTQSARFPDHMYANSPLPSPVLEPPFTPAAVSFATLTSIANRKPRTYWYRTTFLALFVLVVLSVYVLVVAQPSLASIPAFETDGHTHSHLSPDAFRLAALRHKHSWSNNESTSGRPQVQLNASQELAAISSFIASLPHNVIPSTVDPSKPIDPQLVLDFDTRAAHAAEEVETVVKDVWAQHPVMLYSKVSALSLFVVVGPPPSWLFAFHLDSHFLVYTADGMHATCAGRRLCPRRRNGRAGYLAITGRRAGRGDLCATQLAVHLDTMRAPARHCPFSSQAHWPSTLCPPSWPSICSALYR